MAALGLFSPSSTIAAGQIVEVFYYETAAKIKIVGGFESFCDGSSHFWGEVTEYRDTYSKPCRGWYY